MKFHRHTLQLLPTQQHRSYAGAVVVVLERLDGRLSVRHEGRIIASQEAPPSPVFLRNGHGASGGLGERWTAALESIDRPGSDYA